MSIIGLDFDNTLVTYDSLFKKLAIEKNLVDESIIAGKTALRNHLRSKGQDEQFTLLQGEVYGKRIEEAEPAEGMLETLRTIQSRGFKLLLISHKTKVPYAGPSYDLHNAAKSWLNKYGFFSKDGLSWSNDQVYFEDSKQNKVSRIIETGCNYFIDDLPEILTSLPNSIQGILYDPLHSNSNKFEFRINSWIELLSMKEFN